MFTMLQNSLWPVESPCLGHLPSSYNPIGLERPSSWMSGSKLLSLQTHWGDRWPVFCSQSASYPFPFNTQISSQSMRAPVFWIGHSRTRCNYYNLLTTFEPVGIMQDLRSTSSILSMAILDCCFSEKLLHPIHYWFQHPEDNIPLSRVGTSTIHQKGVNTRCLQEFMSLKRLRSHCWMIRCLEYASCFGV